MSRGYIILIGDDYYPARSSDIKAWYETLEEAKAFYNIINLKGDEWKELYCLTELDIVESTG
jgi:hypothetical protein